MINSIFTNTESHLKFQCAMQKAKGDLQFVTFFTGSEGIKSTKIFYYHLLKSGV